MMDAGSRKVEKRNRPPVSCEPCRTRKLKCNRGLPCDACVRREKSSLCNYAPHANRGEPGHAPPRPRNLKDRLNVLENLVSSFLTGDAVITLGQPVQSEPATGGGRSVASSADEHNRFKSPGSAFGSSSGREDALAPEIPHIQETGDGQVNCIDSSHWLSILDDIKEVREHFSVSNHSLPQSERGFDVDRVTSDASLLFPSNQGTNIDEILTSLPSQPICDMLLSWYFNSRYMVLGIIHPGKFQTEYTAFWESPSTASPLWTALLFSVLAVTASLRRGSRITELDSSIPPTRVLQQRTAQCLILGRYATANAYALEAFILHLQSWFMGNESMHIDPWFEMGTIIRLAFRMGYHRDPSNLTGISTFEGEMRRRVWLNLFQIDALMCFGLGFPSMIPTEFCDTGVPRNLEYSDLHVDMTELPPPRPLSEQTPILYAIVKASVMGVFKKIVAHLQSLSVPVYERTIALDAEMNRAYSAVPELFKRRDVSRSFIDNSVLIHQRCTIEILYLKGLIVLHRRYISGELQNPRFEHSRQACVEAALDILARQADLHRACNIGGRLYEDRWMFLSLPAHDFLLAAMVVCLDLSVRMRSQKGGITYGHDCQQSTTSREYLALQTSQRIWAMKSATSTEAHIAALALDLMTKKVAENDARFPPTNDVLSRDMDSIVDSALPYAGPMSHMIDGSENIDWALLDQYLQNMDVSILDASV